MARCRMTQRFSRITRRRTRFMFGACLHVSSAQNPAGSAPWLEIAISPPYTSVTVASSDSATSTKTAELGSSLGGEAIGRLSPGSPRKIMRTSWAAPSPLFVAVKRSRSYSMRYRPVSGEMRVPVSSRLVPPSINGLGRYRRFCVSAQIEPKPDASAAAAPPTASQKVSQGSGCMPEAYCPKAFRFSETRSDHPAPSLPFHASPQTLWKAARP